MVRDARDCAVDVETAHAPNVATTEVDAEVWAEAGITDPTPLFCSESSCFTRIDARPVTQLPG